MLIYLPLFRQHNWSCWSKGRDSSKRSTEEKKKKKSKQWRLKQRWYPLRKPLRSPAQQLLMETRWRRVTERAAVSGYIPFPLGKLPPQTHQYEKGDARLPLHQHWADYSEADRAPRYGSGVVMSVIKKRKLFRWNLSLCSLNTEELHIWVSGDLNVLVTLYVPWHNGHISKHACQWVCRSAWCQVLASTSFQAMNVSFIVHRNMFIWIVHRNSVSVRVTLTFLSPCCYKKVL